MSDLRLERPTSRGRRKQIVFLEHAQLRHDPDGRLRLRAKERRAGLEKVASVLDFSKRGA